MLTPTSHVNDAVTMTGDGGTYDSYGTDDRKSTKLDIRLEHLPGPQSLRSERHKWMKDTIHIFNTHGLLAVAKGDAPAEFATMIDHDMSMYPELPPDHRHFESRQELRIKYERENQRNNLMKLQTLLAGVPDRAR